MFNSVETHSRTSSLSHDFDDNAQIDRYLQSFLKLRGDSDTDPLWAKAFDEVRRFALRPAKRIRPRLMLAGYTLASGQTDCPPAVWQFASAIELLHIFMLIHDDVADQAEKRRGDVSLHRILGSGKLGEDLAIVAGDYLFARALEGMLSCGSTHAALATSVYLRTCRSTASGQYLDLILPHVPLHRVTLWQTLKTASLKTARYSFSTPLYCGAMLAGAEPEVLEGLERLGRYVGVAYQLKDDLIGLFGNEEVEGKTCLDAAQGKRTFPLIAAFLKASPADRAEMEQPCSRERMQTLVDQNRGRTVTEKMIARSMRSAGKLLKTLPVHPAGKVMLENILSIGS